MQPTDFVAALRGAAPYVHAHRGRVFVVAFGGEAALRPDFDRLIYDVALLHSLGVKLVLVHGARPQIDARLREKGLKTRHHNGVRVTDPASLECVREAVGSLRMTIEARLSTSLASTPMGGARVKVAGGNWITARPVGVRDGIDHQLTGEVRRVDAETIRKVLDEGRIALISPIGYSPTGEIFNLWYEDVATAVASQMSAEKLVFLVDAKPDDWKLADETGDAGQISVVEARKWLTSAKDAADRQYLEAALDAADAGVRRIHLIGNDAEGGLLRELYTLNGAGLMLYSDENYESMRDATIEDIGGVLALIQPLEARGVLVPRSREQLELDIDHFCVMVRDQVVIACAALFPFTKDKTGELACVAVHAEYQRGGRAGALLKKLEGKARRKGLKQLVALTTHSPHWFIEHGFRQGKTRDLPAQKQRIYNYQRNSLVLVKDI
jgi:amino-acid N-acetyltransferase